MNPLASAHSQGCHTIGGSPSKSTPGYRQSIRTAPSAQPPYDFTHRASITCNGTHAEPSGSNTTAFKLRNDRHALTPPTNGNQPPAGGEPCAGHAGRLADGNVITAVSAVIPPQSLPVSQPFRVVGWGVNPCQVGRRPARRNPRANHLFFVCPCPVFRANVARASDLNKVWQPGATLRLAHGRADCRSSTRGSTANAAAAAAAPPPRSSVHY
jgi:hypothetical protein